MNSASQYQYHMCSCPKTHPEAVFRPHLASDSLRFKKCPALILKYVIPVFLKSDTGCLKCDTGFLKYCDTVLDHEM